MLIVKIKGGLGNQMFQYAIGRELSYLRGEPLHIDTSWFSNYGTDTKRQFRLYHFELDCIVLESVTRLSQFNVNNIFIRIYRKFIQKFLPLKFTKYVVENSPYYNPNILKLKNDLILDGTWLNEKYFKSVKNEIRRVFSQKPLLNNYFSSIENEIKQKSNSISVHIRRGDYLSNSNALNYHGLVSMEYYKYCINFFEINTEDPKFYFFSDDISWVKSVFGENENFVFVSDESDISNEFIDLYLMSICNSNIIANSTFSWWGAWLNSSLSKIVFAPQKWSIEVPDSTLILPDNWKVIDL